MAKFCGEKWVKRVGNELEVRLHAEKRDRPASLVLIQEKLFFWYIIIKTSSLFFVCTRASTWRSRSVARYGEHINAIALQNVGADSLLRTMHMWARASVICIRIYCKTSCVIWSLFCFSHGLISATNASIFFSSSFSSPSSCYSSTIVIVKPQRALFKRTL